MRRCNAILRALCLLAITAGCEASSGEHEAAGVARVGPAPTSNDCSDAGWADTLRCQALAAAGSAANPQNNWNEAPATDSEIKAYTRVFLDIDETVRCYDGTIPVLYVDEADPPSDKWVISMTGGGSCVPAEGAVAGVIDDATDCTRTYENEAGEMGTQKEPPMKNFFGINNPDPILNPVFSGYNRVRVEKCSYDRYMGRATFDAVSGDLFGNSLTYDAYQQGWPIMVGALNALLPGLTYTTWSWDGPAPHDIVEDTGATLPALADAETILFVGHSGAAHGLMHNIDALVDELVTLGVANADIRVMLGANFTGSGENEAEFATAPGTTDRLYGDVFSGHYAGESIASGKVPGTAFTYDLAAHYTNPATVNVQRYTNWQAEFDTSCLDVHIPLGDEWICLDRHHVLLNHVSTPMFIREDFTDPNKAHTIDGTGHSVTWADPQVDPAVCDWFGSDPCPPLLSLDEHRDRLEKQAQAVIDHYSTDSEMGAEDPSLGSDRPTVYLWMPDCGVHGGAYADDTFFDTKLIYQLSVFSMRTWLEGFMNVAAYNGKGWRIDEWSDTALNPTTSVCPPP